MTPEEKQSKQQPSERQEHHTTVNITNNFNAPIGQHIDHVDKIDFHMDGDGTFHFGHVGSMKRQGSEAPDCSTMAPPEDRARAAYKKLTKEGKRRVLSAALAELRVREKRLFKNKLCWIGIYFVVRDRLDGTISQTDFYDFAVSFTPDGWPESLKIGATTLSNLAHKVNYEDRNEAYYDMADNPWDELCEKYWTLVLNGLLTKK